MNIRTLLSRAVILVATTVAAMGAVAQPDLTTGAFRNAGAIETTLKRGVSTKADVQRLLGVPNGTGAAAFPTLRRETFEIWYYEDIETTDTKAVGAVLEIQMLQQIMLVFFNNGVFDGYMWTSNAATAAAK